MFHHDDVDVDERNADNVDECSDDNIDEHNDDDVDDQDDGDEDDDGDEHDKNNDKNASNDDDDDDEVRKGARRNHVYSQYTKVNVSINLHHHVSPCDAAKQTLVEIVFLLSRRKSTAEIGEAHVDCNISD
ncbi:phosphopantothenoylcysteine decarboxylase subunit VHS3-like [Penaeus monodon]|uniref:phosphopantothenoylcysteine decarboxylase subunit VHS3-like n=1 Tax=Penaeus monodon TaxID=6687 RepID=UPI0018A75FB5|nr:phosphopantothenoylcysteine decarboxylase subunit VHS3-like [Penaeus monodon]